MVEEIAVRLHLARQTVSLWVHWFDRGGLAGWEDAPRAGRPATSPREHVGAIVAAALPDPQTRDWPFPSWTLDRLAAYWREQKGIAMKRSRLGEGLLTEGWRWRQPETWCGERVDPDCAQKRGR